MTIARAAMYPSASSSNLLKSEFTTPEQLAYFFMALASPQLSGLGKADPFFLWAAAYASILLIWIIKGGQWC
jgi:hypothetical protein